MAPYHIVKIHFTVDDFVESSDIALHRKLAELLVELFREFNLHHDENQATFGHRQDYQMPETR